MATYDCEVTGITENPDGTVDLAFIQRVDDVDVGGGVQYSAMWELVQEIQMLSERLRTSAPLIALILAARAYNIDPTFENLGPILGKKFIVNPKSVQVVRIQ